MFACDVWERGASGFVIKRSCHTRAGCALLKRDNKGQHHAAVRFIFTGTKAESGRCLFI
jgi:hypothetical protein